MNHYKAITSIKPDTMLGNERGQMVFTCFRANVKVRSPNLQE
jgi:hypothetical protein